MTSIALADLWVLGQSLLAPYETAIVTAHGIQIVATTTVHRSGIGRVEAVRTVAWEAFQHGVPVLRDALSAVRQDLRAQVEHAVWTRHRISPTT